MKTVTQEKTYLDYKKEHMQKYRNDESIKGDCFKHIGFGSTLAFLSYQMEGYAQRNSDRFGE